MKKKYKKPMEEAGHITCFRAQGDKVLVSQKAKKLIFPIFVKPGFPKLGHKYNRFSSWYAHISLCNHYINFITFPPSNKRNASSHPGSFQSQQLFFTKSRKIQPQNLIKTSFWKNTASVILNCLTL